MAGVDAALLEQVAEAAQQVAETGRTAVCAVVALPRGVHPEHHLTGPPVRDGRLEEVEGAVRAVAPPERLVVDDGRAGRQQLAVVAAVLDLVDVAERDPLDRDAGLGQEADLLQRPGPGLAVGVDGHAGPRVGRRRRAEDRHVAIGGAVLAAGDLDDPGPDRRPVDDRARVVARVDAHLDIRHEQVRQLVLASRAGSSATARRTSRGGGPWQPRGGRRSSATAPRASAGRARNRPASRRPRSGGRPPRRRAAPRVMRSTSARRKSGEISTGFPPTMTRCSWA